MNDAEFINEVEQVMIQQRYIPYEFKILSWYHTKDGGTVLKYSINKRKAKRVYELLLPSLDPDDYPNSNDSGLARGEKVAIDFCNYIVDLYEANIMYELIGTPSLPVAGRMTF